MYEKNQIYIRAKLEKTLDTRAKNGYKPAQ
jgi:hypothetical protein